jgi:hypothetical protein
MCPRGTGAEACRGLGQAPTTGCHQHTHAAHWLFQVQVSTWYLLERRAAPSTPCLMSSAVSRSASTSLHGVCLVRLLPQRGDQREHWHRALMAVQPRPLEPAAVRRDSHVSRPSLMLVLGFGACRFVLAGFHNTLPRLQSLVCLNECPCASRLCLQVLRRPQPGEEGA